MSKKIEVNEAWRQYYWTDESGKVIRKSRMFTKISTVYISNSSHTIVWEDLDHRMVMQTVITQANTAFIDFEDEVVK